MFVMPCEREEYRVSARSSSGSRNTVQSSLVGECILEFRGLNTKKICYKKGVCVSHDRSTDVARTINREFEVTKMKDGSDELTWLGNVSLCCFESDFELVRRRCLDGYQCCAGRGIYITPSLANVDAVSPPVMHLWRGT